MSYRLSVIARGCGISRSLPHLPPVYDSPRKMYLSLFLFLSPRHFFSCNRSSVAELGDPLDRGFWAIGREEVWFPSERASENNNDIIQQWCHTLILKCIFNYCDFSIFCICILTFSLRYITLKILFLNFSSKSIKFLKYDLLNISPINLTYFVLIYFYENNLNYWYKMTAFCTQWSNVTLEKYYNEVGFYIVLFYGIIYSSK